MSTMSKIMTVLAVAGLFVAGAVGVSAQDISWDADEGDWLTETNWNPVGLPGTSDDVEVDRADADVTLNMTEDIDIASLWLRQGEVTVDSTGEHTLRNTSGRDLAWPFGWGNREMGLVVGYDGSDNEATFNINSGTVDCSDWAVVGHGAGSTGTFNVNDGGVFSVGGMNFHIGADGGTGTFNIESGGELQVRNNHLRIGHGDGAAGTFNMHGGTVSVQRTMYLAHEGGTGTFNMSDGDLTVNQGFFISYHAGGVGTFNQTGGSVTSVGDAWRHVSLEGSTGTYIIRNDASLLFDTDGGNEFFTIAGHGSTGTFVKYGSADVEIKGAYGRSGSGSALTIARSGSDTSGTLRAVIDKTGFSPIRVSSGTGTNDNALAIDYGGAKAHLDVRLDGGVMLSGTPKFQLIQVEQGGVIGDNDSWESIPAHLWTVDTGAQGVSVTLDSNYLRGTLDTSDIGEFEGTISMNEGEKVHGYVGISGLEANEENLVQLALGFKTDPTDHTKDDVDFVTALGDAGYTVWDEADLEAAFAKLDLGSVPANTIGVDMTVEADDEGWATFAWDLEGYNSEPLELSTLTVIPEPSSIAILVLGLAAVIRLRLRGRRNF